MSQLQAPTAEECSAHAKVSETDYDTGYAIWYPQMGGYVGKAIALIPKGEKDGCFDVLIWHDGAFPFGGEGSVIPPIELHHCDAGQFVRFGEKILDLQKEEEL